MAARLRKITRTRRLVIWTKHQQVLTFTLLILLTAQCTVENCPSGLNMPAKATTISREDGRPLKPGS
jgi:hypothetical protein